MRKILSGRRSNSRGPFQMVIDTSKVGLNSSNNDQYAFPIINGTDKRGRTINFTIDWGDGTTSDINSSNYATAGKHTYSSPGTYLVSATGSIAGFAAYNGGLSGGRRDAQKITQIRRWGDLNLTGGANSSGFQGAGNAFRGCTNLVDCIATDLPTFITGGSGSSDTGIRGMFTSCSNLNRINRLADWDVSPCNNFNGVFNGCIDLQYDDLSGTIGLNVSNWDVERSSTFYNMFKNVQKCDINMWTSFGGQASGGINFYSMFNGCSNFTGVGTNLWGSKVSAVTNMHQMFYGCKVFNANISGWDTSSCTNMYQMFSGTGTALGDQMIFNQNIGSWDVSNVTDMRGIFSNCASFDQNLSSWDVNAWSQNSLATSPITNPGGTFQLSTSNYNALLVAWDNYGFPSMPNGTVNFGSSTYSLTSPGNAVVNARNSLISKWGAISDGGGV